MQVIVGLRFPHKSMSVSPVLDSCGNPAILMFQKSFRNKRVVSKQGCCFET